MSVPSSPSSPDSEVAPSESERDGSETPNTPALRPFGEDAPSEAEVDEPDAEKPDAEKPGEPEADADGSAPILPKPSNPVSTHGRCANCGAVRNGPFCSQCGQQDRTRIGPLRTLAADIVDELFSLDTRLLRTLRQLVIRPGGLTADYIHGRRATYYRPFRLFILSGLLLLLMTSIGRTITDSNGGAMLKPMVQIPYSDAKIAQMRNRADTLRTRGSFSDIVRSVFIRATANAAENPERVNQIVQERLSILAAVLLPGLALFLYLLFPGRFFAEHMVHALHLHAFTFLVLSLYLSVLYAVRTIDTVTLASTVVPVAAFATVFHIVGYGLLSFRRVYNAPIVHALWKGAVMLILYLFLLIGAIILYVSGALLLV